MPAERRLAAACLLLAVSLPIARAFPDRAVPPTGVCVAAEIVKERWLGKDRLDQARWLMRNAQYEELDAVSASLLAEAEARYGPYSPEAGLALDYRVHALQQLGRAAEPEVREWADRALAIKETWIDPGDPDLCFSIGQLGAIASAANDIVAARNALEWTLTCLEAAYGAVDPRPAAARSNLASLVAEFGELEAALSMYQQALAVLEATLPQHPNVRITLENMAGVYHDLGDYAAARSCYERSLAHAEKYAGTESWGYAHTLQSLGNLHMTVGNRAEARALDERALAILERLLGPDSFEAQGPLQDLGELSESEGKYAEAKAYYQRALNAALASGDPEGLSVAEQQISLARLLRREGAVAESRTRLETALGIIETQVGSESPDYAVCLSELALTHAAAGDLATALSMAERATALAESIYGPESPYVAGHLADLARIRVAAGDRSGAFEAALRAARIDRGELQLTAESLSEREALMLALARSGGIDLALTLAAGSRDPGMTRRAWDAVVHGRGAVLDELALRRRSATHGVEPQVAVLWAELAASRQRLARLVVAGPGERPVEVHRASLDKAQAERDAAERALAAASRAFRSSLARSAQGLDAVMAALPEGSALVAYTLYERVSASQGRFGDDGSVPAYLAFVTAGAGADPVVVPLGTAQSVDELVRELLARVAQEASAPGRSTKRTESSFREAARALRQRIWDPVAPLVARARRVFVVPDGSLHMVPFAALPRDAGGYLLEDERVLHQLATERDLAGPPPATPGRGLLALGGPAFDDTALFAALAPRPPAALAPAAATTTAPEPVYRGPHSTCGALRDLRFEPLPGAAREATEVAALWRSSAAPAGDRDAMSLTGAAASETALKLGARGHRVLHLATHGFFLGRECPGASVAPVPRSTPAVALEVLESPLLMSGLAFAGANHRDVAGPDEDDGVLTAEEIAALDLSGVEWAVLSACETGIGEVQAGEGVFGLQRAFQVAGARTVITSLWAVDDETTRAFMSRLYRARLAEGRPTDEAVREASLAVLGQRRAAGAGAHPFYWAGFAAVGDWR